MICAVERYRQQNQLKSAKAIIKQIIKKKNQMKKLLLFLVSAVLIVAGGMFLQSCTNDVLEDKNRRNQEKEVFLPLVMSQTTLENNQFVFHLTLEEAIRNGMPREVFFEIQRQIEQANEDILAALADPEIDKVFIADPQATMAEFQSPRLRSGIEHENELRAIGSISAPSRAWSHRRYITVPTNASKMYVRAISTCWFCSVTVRVLGASLHFQGAFPSLQGPFSVSRYQGRHLAVYAKSNNAGIGSATFFVR